MLKYQISLHNQTLHTNRLIRRCGFLLARSDEFPGGDLLRRGWGLKGAGPGLGHQHGVGVEVREPVLAQTLTSVSLQREHGDLVSHEALSTSALYNGNLDILVIFTQ